MRLREERAQRMRAFIRALEQPLGIDAKTQDPIVDGSFAIIVDSHSSDVLQAQIAVAIDFGARQPGPQIGLLPGVGGEQTESGVKANLIERLRDALIFGTRKAPLESVNFDHGLFGLPREHPVVTAT